MTENYGIMFFKMLVEERDEETFSKIYSANTIIVNKLITLFKQECDYSSLQWISSVVNKIPY